MYFLQDCIFYSLSVKFEISYLFFVYFIFLIIKIFKFVKLINQLKHSIQLIQFNSIHKNRNQYKKIYIELIKLQKLLKIH